MGQIPQITKNLLIINIICFLATVVMGGQGTDFNDFFGLHYWQSTRFSVWQLVTYMFMHASWTHLFFNMFALWMFGGIIERTFGEKRYLIYYLVCGLGAALCQELSQTAYVYSLIAPQGGTLYDLFHLSMAERTALNALTTVGASGSIYGILLAFGMCYPEQRMFIFPLPVPIKAKWFVCGYAVIELLSALGNGGDGVAHVAHLGGMLFGFIMIRMWRKTSSSFNGWDGYEIKEKKSTNILGKIRRWFHIDEPDFNENDNENDNSAYNERKADWQYNAEKKKRETEIDIILDKIRRSGYASLTAEEKRKLFEQSNPGK